MKKIFLVLAFTLFLANLSAQTPAKGHEIKINIKNCKDTMMLLVYYQFDKSFIIDTCKKIVKGNIIFKGPKPLDKGMYYLVNQDKIFYFEFLITDNDQKLMLTTDTTEMIRNLKAGASNENDEFFAYVKFFSDKNKEFMALGKQTKGMSSKDSTTFLNGKVKTLNESVIAFETAFMERNKGTYAGDIVNLKMEKEAKDIPKASNGRPDSMYIYTYYKAHYWDGVNFEDDGILRSRFFADRIKKYFNTIVIQNPDSVNAEIDRMMAKTKSGTMMQKILLSHFLSTYETSKVMGFDKVFVHIIDKYIRTGMGKDVYPEESIAAILKRGDILKPLLLGNIAPDLFMIDTIGHKVIANMGFDTVKTSQGATKLYYSNVQKLTQTFVSLHNVKADYLVVVFWDVDCGHCKTEIPILLKEYQALQKDNYDIKVFSVYTKEEYEKWRKFIVDSKYNWINVYDPVHINNIKDKYDVYSTPVIYVLDRNKVIKAKRIGTEQVKDIVKQMEREYKLEKEKK